MGHIYETICFAYFFTIISDSRTPSHFKRTKKSIDGIVLIGGLLLLKKSAQIALD
jgi:hypothetical protein